MTGKAALLISVVLLNLAADVRAQDKKAVPEFSARGLKVSIATAAFDMISERDLEEGEGGLVSLGYGMSDKSSIWLAIGGTEHRSGNEDAGTATQFGLVELQLEHKFSAAERFQPYGKVGLGVYSLEPGDSRDGLLGLGMSIGVGVDYFWSKHFGIGAEVTVKKLDYIKRSQDVQGGELVTDLQPNLNGDTAGFLLRLVIQ